MSITDIYNYLAVTDTLVASGQPTEDQLRSVKDAGFAAVVNLATFDSKRSIPNERDVVDGLSMEYHHIPVRWKKPTEDDLLQFFGVMRSLSGKKVLIHCIANYRVMAFLSLYAMADMGWSESQAIDLINKIWDPNEDPVWRKYLRAMMEKLIET